MSRYLRWQQLTPNERAEIGNGCGPSWCGSWIRNQLFGWFFLACCNHHDFGYIVGGNELRRWYCDWQFFKAMLSDSARKKRWLSIKLPLAILFYFFVIVGGWYSFSYGTPISTREEFFSRNTIK